MDRIKGIFGFALIPRLGLEALSKIADELFKILMKQYIGQDHINRKLKSNNTKLKLRDAIPKLPVNAEKSRTSKATFTPTRLAIVMEDQF
ncbi:20424_t:CDS:2, partial [Rhizophagus irregularis]